MTFTDWQQLAPTEEAVTFVARDAGSAIFREILAAWVGKEC